MYMNLSLSRMTNFFFPDQGESGEHVGRRGSESEAQSKGKKKHISGGKGANIVAM